MVVDWDEFGRCVLCHKSLMMQKLIDNVMKDVFTPDRTETQFLLNDGSKMRVGICQKCKDELTLDDEPKIMQSVIKGWEKEIDDAKWAKERKKDYMKIYSKKKIVCKSEGISETALSKKLKKYKEK